MWIDSGGLTLIQKEYWDTIEKLRLNLNEKPFLELKNFEVHSALYLPGTFYKKHLNRFAKVKHRTISCFLYLNQDGEEKFGSQLIIYENDEREKSGRCKKIPSAKKIFEKKFKNPSPKFCLSKKND